MSKTQQKLEHRLLVLEQKCKSIRNEWKKTLEVGNVAIASETEHAIFLARFFKIEQTFDEFKQIEDEMFSVYIELERGVEIESVVDTFAEVKDMYYKIIAIESSLKKHAVVSKSSEVSSSTSRQHTPKLPEIALSRFDGNDVTQWPSFRDNFQSLIHSNERLSDMDKFQYLLSVTTGQAGKIVRSISCIAVNYSTAFETLCNRYENKRLLANSYLHKILSLKALPDSPPVWRLQEFVTTLEENITALKQMKINKLDDFVLFYLAVRQLDTRTRSELEEVLANQEFPSISQLVDFLNQRSRVLEMANLDSKPLSRDKPKPASSAVSHWNTPKTFVSLTEQKDAFKGKCPACDEEHRLLKCPTFLSLTPHARKEKVTSLRLCYNCLGTGHGTKQCRSKFLCKTCNKTHHTLLHFDRSTSTSENSSSVASSTVTAASATSDTTTVLLGTAVAHVADSQGRLQPIRMLIDSGSQVSFLSLTCFKRLGFTRMRKFAPQISGLGQSNIPLAKGLVTLSLSPVNTNTQLFTTDAVVLAKISSDLPSTMLPSTLKQRFAQLELADPKFDQPGPVDFLLGADLYPNIFPEGQIIATANQPAAMLSVFGWIIMGKVPSPEVPAAPATFLAVSTPLSSLVERFWETEEVTTHHREDPEDAYCIQHFNTTHYRDSTGRYVVALPFREAEPNFENFKTPAQARLRNLEYRLSRDTELSNKYHNFLKEYADLGHMQPALQPAAYLIPHHCVLKPSSSTTQLRVVFDASFTVGGDLSLNQTLCTGPKLQADLPEILLNFRRHRFVFTADISKMYRQILVQPEHRKYQHILWREQPSEPVSEFQLNTVTYGLAPAPFLAMQVLKQLVEDEGASYPLAARAVLNDMYIDDIVTGADSIPAALQLQDELIALLARGGFVLRKWSANHPQLLASIPDSDREIPVSFHAPDENYVKILGVQWEAKSDSFTYRVGTITRSLSKRSVLSNIARMFDPLGWIAPVVFWAKAFLQILWSTGLKWDEVLPDSLQEQWQTFSTRLPELVKLRIPRCVVPNKWKEAQMLGFSDASERGYSAVLYLRMVDMQGGISIHLLKAKSRVAPQKPLTIPKLELCGALLLARLIKSVSLCHEYQIYCFTDSTIVVAWIHTPPHRLKTFVANRVITILDNTTISQWHHIRSEDNPADVASRGILPDQLLDHPLWWSGPVWAAKPVSTWPLGDVKSLPVEAVPEIKTTTSLLVTRAPSFLVEHISRYSSYSRMMRTIAFIFRFVYNARVKGSSRRSGPLGVSELVTVQSRLIKETQQHYLCEELDKIRKGLPCGTALQRLALFLDTDGICRVGGRLKHSELKFDTKHPMLIPGKSHLALLLVTYFHDAYLHAGAQTLLTVIQRKFWIPSARNLIRKIIFRCERCYRLKVTPCPPLMGDLPPERITLTRTFLHIGVDFGGPLLLKEGVRKTAKVIKAYFCVFVCMATKAVHLELVSRLSTEAFLATLERFIARRGLCSDIYSDNGTNFVGAARHLKELYAFFRNPSLQTEVTNSLAVKGIKWHFNPPAAPHFGGLWESCVKATKHHLRRIVGERALTFEEMSTLLVKVEAILNSRPLCPLSADPHSFDVLTPGHFLIGTPLLAIPETDILATALSRLTRWELVKQSAQHFWNRWSREYLHTLQQRTKWTDKRPNFAVGDLVLVGETNHSPLQWPVGRVVEAFPGKDGVVRVVSVRTPKREIFRRPVHKLVPFPPQNL